ncbi:MAG: hypothetical protein HY819_00230 [Acidobacteria bacterium]|nr:hypothetical protein [Acidobacteriota bacterium]
MSLSHAILTDQFLCFAQAGKWHQIPIESKKLEHVIDLVILARTYSRQHIWLLPTSSLYEKLNLNPLVFNSEVKNHWFISNLSQEWKLDHATKAGDYIYQLTIKCYWQSDRDAVYINLPNRLIDWYFSELTQASDLYGAISYLEQVLEIELKNKPNTTGINLIEKLNSTNPTRQNYLKEPESDLSLWHENKPFDLAWLRPLEEKEKHCQYIYVYDKNQQYLSASNIYLGIGEAEYFIKPTFDKKLVGLWKINLTGSSPWDGNKLPHPLGNSREPYLSSGWFATPLVERAIELGYGVEVEEAEIFPQKAKVLAPFHKLLTDALTELKTNPDNKFKNPKARQTAILGVKSVFRSTIGLFDANIYSKRKWSFRPDWRWMIIATARARMLYNIDILLKQGFYLLAVRTDAIYFASNEEIPVSNQYKLEAKYPLKDVAHLFDLPIREFIREMDKLK